MSKILTPNFNKGVALVFFCSILFTNPSFAGSGDVLAQKCLDSVDLTSDFGTPVDTFEDVNPITNIGYTLTDTGLTMKRDRLAHFRCPYTKKDDGEAFMAEINRTCGKILYNNFDNFMKIHFFVTSFYWEPGDPPILRNTGKKCENGQSFDYSHTQNPHVVKLVFCLDGGWKYIPKFEPYDVDAISCQVDKSLCDYGPCEKGLEKNNITGVEKEFMSKCDQDIFRMTHPFWVLDHYPDHKNIKNLFTRLGNKIADKIKVGAGLPEGRSTLGDISLDHTIPFNVDRKSEFVMRFADRTPPRILGCVDGNFPELGRNKPATTGDWYKIEGIQAEDNTGCDIGMCLVLGKIDSFPSTHWADSENWIKEKVTTFTADCQPNYVVLPNTCHGVMHYSIFAWDSNNLMNPGEPLIVEDSPTTCYGLRNITMADLGTNPLTAMPWPIKFSCNPDDINDNNIDGRSRRGQGVIHVRDNDLPNIVIKIESMKNHKKIFFPPLIADGDLPIYDSSAYSSPNGTNSNEYSRFIDGAEAKYFSSYLKTTASSPFVILRAESSSVMSGAESTKISSFISGSDKKLTSFARKYFRLEDYDESDTKKSDGTPEDDESTFGKRNSFGRSVVALLNEPLQEDVEYKISVWADDNVKWATADRGGHISDRIKSIPSGIETGEIKLDIPNQLPHFEQTLSIDKYSSVSKEIKAVFREPTKGHCSSITELSSKRYPYIKVSATDFSGLKREITLFFKVKNEKPVIRVLEHKHGTI